MDHVEGACREAPREAAQERDELGVPRGNAGHQVHRGGQRAAMAHADHAVAAALDEVAEVAGARHAERRERQRALIDVGHDLAEAEAVIGLELFLERDAAGDRAFDEDADQAFGCGPWRSGGGPWCSARREARPLRLASCRRRNAATRRGPRVRPPRPPEGLAGAASTPLPFSSENFFLRCNIFQISSAVN